MRQISVAPPGAPCRALWGWYVSTPAPFLFFWLSVSVCYHNILVVSLNPLSYNGVKPWRPARITERSAEREAFRPNLTALLRSTERKGHKRP